MINIDYGFDRSKFLLQIVGQFNTKIREFDPEKDKLMKDDPEKEKIMKEKLKMERLMMDRVYKQWITILEKQKTPFNQMDITEKIRIVKECYRSFKSDEFRYGLRGISPRKIAQDFGEEILGILKRKYDMSDKFSPGLIPSRKLLDGTNKKMVGIKPLATNDDRGIVFIDDERGITIQQIGELIYSDGIDVNNDVKQYRVTLPLNYRKTTERVVFTKSIDFDLLNEDKGYEDAIFSELLTINNIDKSNAGGYIGEIIPAHNMYIGEEKDDDGGFYTYQISDKYAFSVDPIAVTAAKIMKKREKDKSTKSSQSDGR